MFLCGRKTKNCPKCKHRYLKEEYELSQCPECGFQRSCRVPVEHEGKACKVHGGNAPRGAAAPGFKTGRHSKYLPTRVAARVQEALDDPELLSIRSDIALLDARWTILAERLFTGESGGLWKQLKERWSDFKHAMQTRDIDVIQSAMKAMDRLVSSGASEERSWRELIKLTNNRASLKQASMNQQIALQQTMTLAEGFALVDQVVAIVIEHVADQRAKNVIVRQLMGLLERGGGGGGGSASTLPELPGATIVPAAPPPEQPAPPDDTPATPTE